MTIASGLVNPEGLVQRPVQRGAQPVALVPQLTGFASSARRLHCPSLYAVMNTWSPSTAISGPGVFCDTRENQTGVHTTGLPLQRGAPSADAGPPAAYAWRK